MDEIKRDLISAFYKITYEESQFLYDMQNTMARENSKYKPDEIVIGLQACRVRELFDVLNITGLIDGFHAWKAYMLPCEQQKMAMLEAEVSKQVMA